MTESEFKLKSGQSGRDFHDRLYVESLDAEARWLEIGATMKADSVQYLLESRDIRPTRIVELGCGSGAVLCELKRRGLAGSLVGVDFSQAALDYLQTTCGSVQTIQADLSEASTFLNLGRADVVVITHTLEHLEEPDRTLDLLQFMDFDYLIAEVPLENLPFGKLKAQFSDRTDNASGHVQFYSRRSFRELMLACGYEILEDRLYAPGFDFSTIKMVYSTEGMLRYVHKLITESILPRAITPIWKRAYHAHFAVLARRRPSTM